MPPRRKRKSDLSLLRSISDVEIKKHHAKGIFTVTQLSHTFRPRRKRKGQAVGKRPRQLAIQALAIRENRVFVLDSFELPKSPIHIYLDFEGDEARRHCYLIGGIVSTSTGDQSFSLWSDGDANEVFEQFLDRIRPLDEFVLFHYGSYELDCFKALRSAANGNLVDKAVAHSFDNAKRRKRLPPTFDVYPLGFVPGLKRPKRMDKPLRARYDSRIRIAYLQRNGKTIPEIMAELGVSHLAVVRGLTRRRRRSRSTGKIRRSAATIAKRGALTMLSFLLSAVAISLSGVMAPGPITAATLAAGARSRHAGAMIALGHAVVEMPLILLLVVGVGSFLESSAVRAGILAFQ